MCGDGSNEMTRPKPCTRSQIISSWRRTRRWFGANPPGRSLMAKWSFMTQVKFLGGMPAAHFPFMRLDDTAEPPGP